ncbi:MAG TPA: EscN/YscN/HrcN family type III secretion system ATPase [Candidatus Cybelea sp.]|nr:EscN/YscN/HrcN family type III secretion system ATPase [Candidatus Cybelea sp.]
MARERLALGTCALGRAIDACGSPLDGGKALCGRSISLDLHAPAPGERAPVTTALWTGVRVVDALLTIGRGARVGIFGAPGAGKTTLVESIVDGCAADAVVVALVGERGREAQLWIDRRDARTTIVCATSDRSAPERVRAARVAVAHAAALRERGLHVLLILDSLARFAAALREIGVAAGESAGRGGYPPSVYAEMARLLEVAGALRDGSITVVATVIDDGDARDPVSEAARSPLDGHIALSSRLAQAGRFPAVDVPASASRTMDAVAPESQARAAVLVRRAIATLDRVDDARALGIAPQGRFVRAAIAAESRIEAFLRQGRAASQYDETFDELRRISELLEEADESVRNSVTLR